MNQPNKLPGCCTIEKRPRPRLLEGVLYGIIPHAGCIAFILASVLGLTAVAFFFKPLLIKSYFFYIMIALSLVFATISAFFYLRKNGGIKEAKNHKVYLTILYGSTILVSVLVYFVIFPLMAGLTNNSITGAAVNLENLNTITLEVTIPCPGHAPLITNELKKVDGIVEVEYSPIRTFKVYYNSTKTSAQKILELEIFKEYRANVIKTNAPESE